MADYADGDFRNNLRKRNRNKTRRTRGGVTVLPFQQRPFAAVDGEGMTDKNGRHHYTLLRAGTHELFNSDGSPLSMHQCFTFLANLPPTHIYIAFSFGYDITMMCRDLPPERAERLVSREKRTFCKEGGKPVTLPVDYQEWRLDYMPGKSFSIKWKDGHWITISDVFSFFQCSFVEALTRWFPERQDVIDKIREGKNQRSDFGGVDRDYIRKYCQLECEWLCALMDKVRDVCYSLDIFPRRWEGPGQLVQALLSKEGVPRNTEAVISSNSYVYQDVMHYSNSAYYGGRFEPAKIGRIKGPIYGYDINSAYAGVYRHLPCLRHGTWQPIRDGVPITGLWIGFVEYRHHPHVFMCGLPIRLPNGTIVFPRAGSGFYWSVEVDAAVPMLESYVVRSGYTYTPNCDCRPFEWVEAIFEERKRIGKTSKGMILKLVLASIYGKLCQSVGDPTFSHPVWASLITAHVRAQLMKAMCDGVEKYPGSDIIMAATDGFYTTRRRGFPLGAGLGEWEEKVHSEMLVVQSGVYFIPGEKTKTRGAPRARVDKSREAFFEAWETYLDGWNEDGDISICTVPVPVTNFVGLALALARGKPETAGQWVDDDRQMAFDWRSKRKLGVKAGKVLALVDASYLQTIPQEWDEKVITTPYAKRIGGAISRARSNKSEEYKLEAEWQPDWNDGGGVVIG